MPRITRNTLLQYIPDNFEIEKVVNTARIFDFNNKSVKLSGFIIYLCEREIRVNDNFALQFAISKSKELNLLLKIIHPKIKYEHLPKQKFIDKQIEETKNEFLKQGFVFEIITDDVQEYLKSTEIALLIFDFNPIINRDWMKKLPYKIYEIDGHNIIPARYVSDKQEYSAATFRRKIYYNIYPFLTEYKPSTITKNEVLEDFLQNKLPYYAEFKNNPSKNVLSGLSKYLNLGFISSQRVALEVIKSNASDINKEAFLEELIVRKELADNFCLFCKNFKTLGCVPFWAKNSLLNHKYDIRTYLYNLEQFEGATTHDDLWNATQKQLIKDGIIHGYLRMYWAKKIVEWTFSPEEALNSAIYLNDKYAYDAPSANGYVGILWAIGGLHDRAFADYPVTGKIRRMTYNSLKSKFNIKEYIDKYK